MGAVAPQTTTASFEKIEAQLNCSFRTLQVCWSQTKGTWGCADVLNKSFVKKKNERLFSLHFVF